MFEAPETQDFEEAVRNLEASAKLTPIYAPTHIDVPTMMLSDAAELKDILLTTIAGNHPNTAGVLGHGW